MSATAAAAMPLSPASSSPLPHVLLAVTGSVASVKVEPLVALLMTFADVRVVASAAALRFFSLDRLRRLVTVYTDEDDWKQYSRGDDVLHIAVSGRTGASRSEGGQLSLS
jgi:phosphopantothenoylcysteine synthetase/decarboxylase